MIRTNRPTGTPTLTLAVAALVLGATQIHAQATVRVIEEDGPIDAGPDTLPLVEPHLSVHPIDANRAVIGAIVAAPDPTGPWHCTALATRDGGDSWVRTELDVTRCIDPWVIHQGGELMITALEISTDHEGAQRFGLRAFRSSDGGRSWSDNGLVGRAYEHQILHTDPVAPDHVYLAARRMRTAESGAPLHTVYVAESRDGGRTFRERIEVRPSNLALNVTGIVPEPDGDIVVSYWDSQRNVDGFGGEGMLDRGRAWALRVAPDGAVSPSLLITDQCASGVERVFPGYPTLASGRDPGRLVHACVLHGLDGIGVTTSEDGGQTWSDPARVAPVPRGEGHARTAMLAVNDDGHIAVAWYDRSGSPDASCQQTYVAGSVDGGRTFPSPVRISTAASCPDTPGNGRVARSWASGGDYGSLSALPDGSFRIVWADSRSGRFRLRTAVFRVE